MIADSSQRTERWWREWRSQDYSWSGLKTKPWEGWSVIDEAFVLEADAEPPQSAAFSKRRAATLQDYWRLDPHSRQLRDEHAMRGELISKDGQPTYHLVHLPLHYDNSESTGKFDSGGDHLSAILSERLKYSGATAGTFRFEFGPSGWRPRGADRRIQLTGAVLRDTLVDHAHDLHVLAKSCCWTSDVDFDAATFGQGTEFAGNLFCANARFHRSHFKGDARFTMVDFCGRADFEGAVFDGECSFFRAVFRTRANFRAGSFGSTVWFNEAQFDNVVFRGRDFLGLAYFGGSRFTGEMDFVSATFSKATSFELITWPKNARDRHASFDHASFRSAVSFKGAGFSSIAAFAGASFEGGLQIDDLGDRESEIVFRSELRDAKSAAVRDAMEWNAAQLSASGDAAKTGDPSKIILVVEDRNLLGWLDEESPHRLSRQLRKNPAIRLKLSQFREIRLMELESGCRTLKRTTVSSANKAREQTFYRYEMIVRRTERSTPIQEKAASYLYELVSNYGSSLLRPIISLACTIVAFAMIGWLWIEDGTRATKAVVTALEFSWTNASRPLSSLVSAQPHGLAALAAAKGDWVSFGVSALATVESAIAIVLFFFFALAVRRRFHIA
jgi:uncharacterized protein YjbI with pentapeptide repeats